jgi:hypothetical protein
VSAPPTPADDDALIEHVRQGGTPDPTDDVGRLLQMIRDNPDEHVAQLRPCFRREPWYSRAAGAVLVGVVQAPVVVAAVCADLAAWWRRAT